MNIDKISILSTQTLLHTFTHERFSIGLSYYEILFNHKTASMRIYLYMRSSKNHRCCVNDGYSDWLSNIIRRWHEEKPHWPTRALLSVMNAFVCLKFWLVLVFDCKKKDINNVQFVRNIYINQRASHVGQMQMHE